MNTGIEGSELGLIFDAMQLKADNNIQHLIDSPLNLRCPHCSTLTALIPISVPRFELMHRFKIVETGIVYRYSSCNGRRRTRLNHGVSAAANARGWRKITSNAHAVVAYSSRRTVG